jgi:N-acetylglutamate synthase-like GNAT family acetyltransferase
LRGQGIGKAIVKELIKQTSDKLFLACIIPEFFHPFGFETVSEIPPSIISKLNYCSQELVVPEKYVAMLLKK